MWRENSIWQLVLIKYIHNGKFAAESIAPYIEAHLVKLIGVGKDINWYTSILQG